MSTPHSLTLRTGQLAYFDGIADLIPCRVLAIEGKSGIGSTDQRITLRVTARKARGYRLGEVIVTNGLHALPRQAVRYECGIPHIRPHYVAGEGGAA